MSTTINWCKSCNNKYGTIVCVDCLDRQSPKEAPTHYEKGDTHKVPTIHVGHAWDGSIVQFPNSARFFMKVCQRSIGFGGVVDITNGEYIPTNELEKYNLGFYVTVISKSLDDFVTDSIDN